MAPTDPQIVSKNIQFEVRNNFKPTIRSDQSDHRIEYGHAPEDDLTWHVDPTGGDWIRGATIKSTGTSTTSRTSRSRAGRPSATG